MATTTKIAWCDHTFNYWIGCSRISPGCLHCYAETFEGRWKRVDWGRGQPRYLVKDHSGPWRWDRRAANEGRRRRVFTSSLSDVLDPEVDPAWRVELCEMIERTPHLDWLILTKRIEFAKTLFPSHWLNGSWPANAWMGTSVENQDCANTRIPELIDLPAPVKFLSAEPLLGPVDISAGIPGIDWVIVGGESGHGARPMNPLWVRSLMEQCDTAGVAFFFKQWGAYRYSDVLTTPAGNLILRDPELLRGKKSAILYPKRGGAAEELTNEAFFALVPGDVIGVRVGSSAPGDDLLDGQQYQTWPVSKM